MMRFNKNKKKNAPQSEIDLIFNEFIRKKKFTEALLKLENISDKTDDNYCIAKGVCLFELKRYEEAIAHYQTMKDWKKRSKALLPIARCYKFLDKKDEYLQILLSIPGIDHDPHALNALAICYYDIGNHSLSIETSKKLLKCKIKQEEKRAHFHKCAHLSMARNKESLGLMKDAIVLIGEIPKWQKDHQCLITLGRVYQKDKQYQQAINTFTMISNWKTNKEAVLAVAICYGAIGKHQIAIDLFKTISHENDENILLGLGREMNNIGQTNEAIRFYKKIKDWSNNKKALLAIGCCLNKHKEFETALTYFEKVLKRWNKNKAAILGAVNSLDELERYPESLKLLLRLPNGDTDKQTLIAFGNHYRLKGDCEKSIFTLKKIKNWETDKQTLLSLVTCLVASGRRGEAIDMIHRIPNWESDVQALYAIGRIYEDEKKYELAIETYKKGPDWELNSQLLLAIGACYCRMELFEEAIHFYQQIENWQHNKQALMGIGIVEDYSGQSKSAIATYQRITNWEKDQDALIAISRCNENLGLKNDAIVQLLKQTPNWEKNKKVSFAIARIAARNDTSLNKKNYFEHIPNWNKNKKILLSLAETYDPTSDEKINTLKLIENWEEDEDALVMIGRSYKERGEYDRAINDYYKKIPGWEKSIRALLGIAHAYEAMEREQEALHYFEEAHQLQRTTDTSISLGRCYQKLGLYADAIKTFQFPNWEQRRLALLGVAHCLIQMNLFDEALENFRKITGWQDDEDVIVGMASCFEYREDYDEAISLLKTIKNWEKNEKALLGIGHCLKSQGFYEQAEVYFKKVLALFPNDSDVLITIGITQRLKGDDNAAMETFNQIPHLEENKSALLAISRSYEEKQEFHQAISVLQKYANWETDKQCVLTIGNIYKRAGLFSLAFDQFTSLPGWENDTPVLVAIGNCLEAQGNYQEALNVLFSIPNWEQHKAALLAVGFCYSGLGYYQDAIRIFKQIENWQKDELVLLAIANQYSNLYDYDSAYAHFKMILHWDKKKSSLLGMAISLTKQGCYDESRDLIRTIPNWEKDEQALLTMAICESESGRDQEAINILLNNSHLKKNKKTLVTLAKSYIRAGRSEESYLTFKSIHDWESDSFVLLNLARCYFEEERYQEALDTFKKIANWDKNREALLGIGSVYMEMGKYDEALIDLQKISHYQTDMQASLSISMCLRAKGKYSEAIDLLKKITHWETNKNVLLTIARIYQEYGKYKESINTLKRIQNWQHDKQALLGMGHVNECLGKLDERHYDEAIEWFMRIPGWETDKQALLSLARCHQTRHAYRQAINTFKMISDYDNDQQAQLGIACCYDAMGLYEKSETIYKSLLDRYPNYLAVNHYYCRHLILQNSDATLLINRSMARWLFCYHFYHLKLMQYYQSDDFDAARNLLQQVNQQFPYHIEAQLDLVRFLLMVGDSEQASLKAKEFKAVFRENSKVAQKFNKLIKNGPMLKIVGKKLLTIDDEDEVKEVVLPESISKFFNSYNNIVGTHYLVGSTVLGLLSNDFKNNDQMDLDFISTTKQTERLEDFGFTQSKYIPNLYTQTKEGKYVDFYVIPSEEKESQAWLKKKALSCDFSICSLICTKEGKIFDTLGIAFQDIKEKRLRMIGNPSIRLAEDPIRLLRAVKYMTLGFTPDRNLNVALRAWHVGENMDYNHLYTVTRKHLRSVNKELYVKFLKDYGLLNKLFNLDESKELSYLIIALEGIIRETSQRLYDTTARASHGFFARSVPQQKPQQPQEGYGASLYRIGQNLTGYLYDQFQHYYYRK